MTKNSYDKALDDAVAELADLLSQRAVLDTRIAQLRETVNSLRQLGGPRQSQSVDIVDRLLLADMGLADACLEVLRAADKPLTGLEVKHGLERMGFDLSQYSNPLATIYPTLNRLAVKDKIDVEEADGRRTYKMKPSLAGRYYKNILSRARAAEPIEPIESPKYRRVKDEKDSLDIRRVRNKK